MHACVCMWLVSACVRVQANDQSTAGCGQCVYAPHPASLTTPWDCAYISPKEISCGRPKGENNKGIVDFWRRPKEDFPYIAALFNEKA